MIKHFYTTDFSANKIKNGNLEQLIIPKSSIHGSNQINEEILKIIKQVIGKDKIKKIEVDEFFNYLELLNEIERKKKQIKYYTDEKEMPEHLKINIDRLSLKCTGFFKHECEGTYENYKIKYNDKEMYIPYKTIKDIIEKFVDKALEQINHVLIRAGQPNYIILTGGFSSNNIFKEKIYKSYLDTNYRIIFLQNPQETVMRGSSLFGLKPTKIERRIIPINIAVLSTYERKNGKEKCLNQFNDTKDIRCTEYIEFFKRDKSISNGKVIEKRIYPDKEQKVKIYYSYKDMVNNDNKFQLEIFDLPQKISPMNERNIIVKMEFSNYIKVTVIEKNLNFIESKIISYPTQELPI